MRIAYLDPKANSSPVSAHGESVRTAQFIDALTTHGIDVERFTSAPRNDGCDAAASGSAADESLREQLRRYSSRIDLVYQRYSPRSQAGLSFAREAWLPFFLEVDDPEILNPRSSPSAINDSVMAAADMIIVASPALRQCALEGGIPRHKVRVLDYAVSAAVLATKKRARRLPKDRFVVGYLGSLETSKGTQSLLEAFAKLRTHDPRYHLLVVGGGPLRQGVQDYCTAQQLDGCVELTGRVPHHQVPAYLAQMDAGLAPYPSEACGDDIATKIWEYAAARVPIIASAGPGSELRELFPHKQAAMLTRPGDTLDIAKRTIRLCEDIDLARGIARCARLRAKRSTWSRVAAQIEGLYQKFLSSQLYG